MGCSQGSASTGTATGKLCLKEMPVDTTAALVGGLSLATLAIQKFKFYIKKNGIWNCGLGCQDKPLQEEDELEVRTQDLGDVKVLYVKPKHHLERESSEESK